MWQPEIASSSTSLPAPKPTIAACAATPPQPLQPRQVQHADPLGPAAAQQAERPDGEELKEVAVRDMSYRIFWDTVIVGGVAIAVVELWQEFLQLPSHSQAAISLLLIAVVILVVAYVVMWVRSRLT